jgi:hypothetical protein
MKKTVFTKRNYEHSPPARGGPRLLSQNFKDTLYLGNIMRRHQYAQKTDRKLCIKTGWSAPTFLFGPFAPLSHGDWTYAFPLFIGLVVFGYVGYHTGGIGWYGIPLVNLSLSFTERAHYADKALRRGLHGHGETTSFMDPSGNPALWVFIPLSRTLRAGHPGLTSVLCNTTIPSGYHFCRGFEKKEPAHDEIGPDIRMEIVDSKGAVLWEMTSVSHLHLSDIHVAVPVKENEKIVFQLQRLSDAACCILENAFLYLTKT